MPLHQTPVFGTTDTLIGEKIRQLVGLSSNMIEIDSAKTLEMTLNSLENSDEFPVFGDFLQSCSTTNSFHRVDGKFRVRFYYYILAVVLIQPF